MKKPVYVIMCIWLFIILGFILNQEYTLITGKKVLLKTVPVDPRDLFMGDYVILNYDIAQINYSKYDFSNNQTVYVKLNLDTNNIASVDEILANPPRHSLYLKGKVGGCNTTIPFYKNGKCVNFGIESYYVKEKTGRELEQNLRNGALVKVKINKNGNAKVIGFVK